MTPIDLTDATSDPKFVDTICICGHWYEEHDKDGRCELGSPFEAEQCQPHAFVYSEDYTLDALSERG